MFLIHGANTITLKALQNQASMYFECYVVHEYAIACQNLSIAPLSLTKLIMSILDKMHKIGLAQAHVFPGDFKYA